MLTWYLSVSCFAEKCWWGNATYSGKPWTQNVSRPNNLNNALNGRHISLWQSHGRYYDHSSKEWKWQRPFIFSTTEDLFTQTIVVPYLFPMLESAGAVVFTPRERDMQTHEVIVDNDAVTSGYHEGAGVNRWRKSRTPGFAIPSGNIIDGYNPFEKGTVRVISTTQAENNSYAAYQPRIPQSGKYAVYVSYVTEENSIDDVLYSVYHKGQRTDFHVNQQMGGGTWVYLGTFDFDAGSSLTNRVVVSSKSSSKGVVTTDAIRFGGGMGNIARGPVPSSIDLQNSSHVSGMPRFLEGARYYAQWAGAPRKVYAVYDGRNDYKEDINVRSLMTNWLSGGSSYNPDSTNINPYDTIYTEVQIRDTIHIAVHDSTASNPDTVRDSIEVKIHTKTVPSGFRHFQGKKVPFDLSLAIHSDAGYHRNMKSIFGSLAICTTDYNNKELNAGVSRSHSKDFAMMLLENAGNDLSTTYGTWATRQLYDRDYSESRLPGIPSAILETLSHQSFPDMKYAHDPNFKFTLARSIYKTILRYEAEAHGDTVIVEPLSPTHFSVRITDKGIAVLSWKAQQDTLEVSAMPTGYNVYMSEGVKGYDNGTHIRRPLFTLQLKTDSLYRFRITATNDGGESFPTEELCAVYHSATAKTVLIVNGFNRQASPAVIDSLGSKGFDIAEDPGLSYGPTACWSGQQKVFSTASVGREGSGSFGYSGHELQGMTIAGNDFNYVGEHAEAIVSAGKYNVVSSSRAAVEEGSIDLSDYDCIDLILANERNDGYSIHPYKTFTPLLQKKLKELYSADTPGSLTQSVQPEHPALIVSGSYIASDMQSTPEDSAFLTDVLHCQLDSVVRTVNDVVSEVGGREIPLIHSLNANHYATTQSDVLKPLADAIPFIKYSDGTTAAITIPNKSCIMGFPLECVESKKQRISLMHDMLNLLIKQQ